MRGIKLRNMFNAHGIPLSIDVAKSFRFSDFNVGYFL